tara:strand:- start:250 stop:1347 length:1098 start_codon:yes stop_codon:yes gene_type:complete
MNLESKYSNKTVIVTGHTGFKGSWLSIWLHMLGANVIGISNEIPTEPSNFKANNLTEIITDLRLNIEDESKVREIIKKYNPDYIFNLAAQSLVRESYFSPLKTFKTNAIGSANILNSVRDFKKRINCIMITSDKVYRNFELKRGYKEDDLIGGKDPYSASKGMAELIIYSFYQSYFNDSEFVRLSVGRAGNVIGGGDWANDRVVPDGIRAWSGSEILKLRNPNSTRPWQHVLEPISGYLLLGALLDENQKLNGENFNFGPPEENDFSVKELIEQMAKYWENAKWEKEVSIVEAQMKEAGLLKLDCSKSFDLLKWQPVLSFEDTARMTASWYLEFYKKNNTSMLDYTMSQVEEYSKLAKKKHVIWS